MTQLNINGSLMLDIAGESLTAEDRALLRAPEVAGLILFARNTKHPKQVLNLTRAIRRIRPDLLIAIDQEGGRVQRLCRGVTALPSAGNLQDAQHAFASGWIMAHELRQSGIDFSFAPVLDIDHGRNAVIGNRAFTGSLLARTQLAKAYIDGMNSAGMAATGKHFPGHGWADADSHTHAPIDNRSQEDVMHDMQVFVSLLPKLQAIMPAHVTYPEVDAKPACFSAVWLKNILRQELQFKGLVFSDDLSMHGAHVMGNASDRIEAAIIAGCDIGLVCNDRASAEEALIHLQKKQISPCLRTNTMLAGSPSYAQWMHWQTQRQYLSPTK